MAEEKRRSLEECRRRLPLPALWAALGLTGKPKRSMASPFRDDARDSFSVFQQDGRWYWRDHATDESGDEVDLIEKARGIGAGEAIKVYHELARVSNEREPVPATSARKPAKPRPTKVVAVYDYHDEGGRLLHQTLRYEPKDFRQRRPAQEGEESTDGWKWTLEGIRTVLFHLPQISGAGPEKPIFFVEGEKDAKNLAELGLLATTVPMGANKWRPDYTASLAGKWVVILGDHDEAGSKHVARVTKELGQAPERLGVIHLSERWPECPPKGDISDWIASVPEGVDYLASLLMEWAQAARDPREWIGCIELTERGAKLVHHSVATAMIRAHGVKFAGELWWRWNSTVWEPMAVQRQVRREMAQKLVELPGGRELVTSSSINAIEDLMASYTAMHPDEFNQHDRELINCRNGMLNMTSHEVGPHRPEYFSTVQIPWNYNPRAECPRWLAWLEETLPDSEVRELMQEIFGYCLTDRLNYHKFFFFFGDGGTGKSTCVEVLTRLIGEANTVSVQLQELDNPFARSQLVGKRLYLAKELTRDSLKHIGLVKAITSGDPISVERKHKDGYSYRPQGRFIMESNVRANTPDSSDGFFRRLYQVTFKQKVRRELMNFGLVDELTSEMDGIFAWALQGLTRLRERGRFAETTDSREAASQLEMHRASVKSFMDQCTEFTDDSSVQSSAMALFTSYRDWCEWEHVKPFYDAVEPFARELLNRIPELRTRRLRRREGEDRLIFYVGVKFKDWKTELGVKEVRN